MSRAIKLTNGEDGTMTSNRGQKEIIIRKNSSKKLLNRPTSQGGSNFPEDTQVKQKNKYQSNVIQQVSNGLDNSLMNNSNYGGHSNINSPMNMQAMPQFKNNQNVNNTESTNFNSDTAIGSKQIPHPQQQFWKSNDNNKAQEIMA